jgi:dTDP-4-dehydrorhamnose 3,5-epimerase
MVQRCGGRESAVEDLKSRFRQDSPRPKDPLSAQDLLAGKIEGCSAVPLVACADERGSLFELLTVRDQPAEPIVHVYQVWAEPLSVRGWIYHARQSDRLCFTAGRFRIALYDLRSDSSTAGALAQFEAGEANPVLLTIPPLVAHWVQNAGPAPAAFVNLPTAVYRHANPDKFRASPSLIPLEWGR